MPRRVAAATLCLIAACVTAGCGGDDDPPAARPDAPSAKQQESRGAAAERFVFWAGCERVAALTDDELDLLEESGVDGFVCMAGRLRDFGGTQDFTGDEDAALSGDQFELQRTLRDSEIVERAEARGMKMYLGAYLSNYNNTATPLVDWFDDEAWSQVALPRLGDLAAAAELLGFDGLALDQELYGQKGGVETATWEWDYPGNTHSEDEVREAARRRGEQVMDTVLGEFQGAEFAVYNFSFPGDWNEFVKERGQRGRVRGSRPPLSRLLGRHDVGRGLLGDPLLRLDLLQDAARRDLGCRPWYDVNQIYAAFSRGFENWDYASERVHVSPFSWLNAGPDETSTFDDAQSPEYVSDQLEAFRKWSSGGEFANFVYGGLDPAQYEEYRSAMEAASSPGTVDEADPVVELVPTGSHPVIAGTATDNLGIKTVRWQDDQGGSGVAELQLGSARRRPRSGIRMGDALVGARRRAQPGGVGGYRDGRGHQGPHVRAGSPGAGMRGPDRSRGEPGRARPDLLRDLAAGGWWPGVARAGAGPLPRRPRPRVLAVTTAGAAGPEPAGFPIRASRKDRHQLVRQPAAALTVLAAAAGGRRLRHRALRPERARRHGPPRPAGAQARQRSRLRAGLRAWASSPALSRNFRRRIPAAGWRSQGGAPAGRRARRAGHHPQSLPGRDRVRLGITPSGYGSCPTRPRRSTGRHRRRSCATGSALGSRPSCSPGDSRRRRTSRSRSPP